MIKNLKTENEYLQRQIETLRRITARETNGGPMTPKPLASSFTRPLSQPPRFEETTIQKGDDSQYLPLQRKPRQSS